MTPKIIELKQAPVVLVELPKGCKHEKLLGKSGDGTFLLWDITNNFDDDNRPHGKILIDTEPRNRWRILGILSDLTEEQFAECVDKYDNSNPARYVNYTYKKPNGGMQVSRVTFPWCRKASDSFYSLLESENVYTENPYQKPTLSPMTSEDSDDFLFPTESGTEKWAEYENQFLTWKQNQSRTVDPTRTVVLLRKED